MPNVRVQVTHVEVNDLTHVQVPDFQVQVTRVEVADFQISPKLQHKPHWS